MVDVRFTLSWFQWATHKAAATVSSRSHSPVFSAVISVRAFCWVSYVKDCNAQVSSSCSCVIMQTDYELLVFNPCFTVFHHT